MTHEQNERASLIPIRLVNGKFQSDDPEMQPRSLIRYTAENQPVQFGFDLERELPSGRLVIELENMQDRRSALWLFFPGKCRRPCLP